MPVALKNPVHVRTGAENFLQTHRYFNPHCHSHFSNQRYHDSKLTVPELCHYGKAKGMAGIALTDHGAISGSVKVAKLMDQNPDFFNGKDGKGTFKVVIGEEIYLDDADIIADAVKHNKKTKFYHFVLTAKDDIGLHALRIITSNSWRFPIENIWNDRPQLHGFFYRGLRRLPTYKDWLAKLMSDPKFGFKGHVFAGTACLGSELSQSILADDKPRAKKFIHYIEDTFGKDQCYFEMMPAHRDSQNKVNKTLWNISHGKGYFADNTGAGIPCVISTDAHYIDSRDRQIHSDFLKSENPGRDVEDFYYYAHMYKTKELLDYFPKNVVIEACQNSLNLLSRYAPIWHATNEKQMAKRKDHPTRLHYIQEIPKSPTHVRVPGSQYSYAVLPHIDLQKYAKKYHIDWSKYKYFNLFDRPENYRNTKTGKKLSARTINADRYCMIRLFRGMNQLYQQLKRKSAKNHTKFSGAPFDNTYLSEINWELMTLHQKTEYFHEPMSAYFLTVFYAVIDTCWRAGSLVGAGRGSAGEWILDYLLHITQVNSIKWGLWAPRFLAPQRDDQPDIDLDSESSKRPMIIVVSRKKFGFDRVANFSTFGFQTSKNTIYAACRGRGINYTTQRNLASLLPADARGMGNISLHDAFFGNKKKGIPVAKKFKAAVNRYPGLEQSMLGITGRIRGIGEHASGVAFFNEPLTQRNAVMRTNRSPGIIVTQYSAHDSAYASSMKYDMLTLSTLDIQHEAERLLIWAGKMKKIYVPNYKFVKLPVQTKIINGKKVKINGKWVKKGMRFSLYKTHMHYFGPQALDFTSKGMYDMLFKGEVTDAFEFSSIVGRDALLKIHATDFSALVAANALMRLTVDTQSKTYESQMMKKYWGKEQPIDRYVRYRDHPGSWDNDMKKFGLNDHERAIMHTYLGRHRGVCYSQEDLMKIDMRICFGIKNFLKVSPKDKESYVAYNSANTLRKAVAKKDPKILEQARQEFYKAGEKRNVRKIFLDYIWYNCAVPAKNYSFNLSHGVAYTINLIIEMNICYRFGPVFWQTACLSVNAGMYGDSPKEFKNANYDKLTRAIGDPMISSKLIAPNINHSGYGFLPYHNKILYGLYPITGIGVKDCEKIFAERKKGQFKSLKDFVDRTGLSDRKNMQLIKAGCFDAFDKNRVRLMGKYLVMAKPLKKRLTTTQIPKIILANKTTKFSIPEKYMPMVRAYQFRSLITGRNKVPMNDHIKHIYLTKYADKVQPYVHRGQTSLFGNKNKNGKSYSDVNGQFKIDTKIFNRWYQKYIDPLRQWLKTKPARVMEASVRRKQLWMKYCIDDPNSTMNKIDSAQWQYWIKNYGNYSYLKSVHEALPSAWEMNTLNCYIRPHELNYTPIVHAFNTQNFNKLPEEPKVISKTPAYHGHYYYKNYQSATICGTVISKVATKALVFLLTDNGIVNVRVGRWRYPAFNKRITKKVPGQRKKKVLKSSWFNRGTRLLCVGYRREDNFFLNNRGTAYKSCMYKIKGYGSHAYAVDTQGRLLFHLTKKDYADKELQPTGVGNDSGSHNNDMAKLVTIKRLNAKFSQDNKKNN